MNVYVSVVFVEVIVCLTTKNRVCSRRSIVYSAVMFACWKLRICIDSRRNGEVRGLYWKQGNYRVSGQGIQHRTSKTLSVCCRNFVVEVLSSLTCRVVVVRPYC